MKSENQRMGQFSLNHCVPSILWFCEYLLLSGGPFFKVYTIDITVFQGDA